MAGAELVNMEKDSEEKSTTPMDGLFDLQNDSEAKSTTAMDGIIEDKATGAEKKRKWLQLQQIHITEKGAVKTEIEDRKSRRLSSIPRPRTDHFGESRYNTSEKIHYDDLPMQIAHKTNRSARVQEHIFPADNPSSYLMSQFPVSPEFIPITKLLPTKLERMSSEALDTIKRLKREAIYMRRTANFLDLILSYHAMPEVAKNLDRDYRMSIVYGDIQMLKESIIKMERYIEEGDFKDLIRGLDLSKRMFNRLEIIRAKHFEMVSHSLHVMLPDDAQDAHVEADIHECSASVLTSSKSENMTRPSVQGPESLHTPPPPLPREIVQLAINSAVHQIVTRIEYGIKYNGIVNVGISGRGAEDVGKALKDHPKILNIFSAVESFRLTRSVSLQQAETEISGKLCPRKRLLLIVDCVDEEVKLSNYCFTGPTCTVFKAQRENIDGTMTMDLEIRMEDHPLPWSLFYTIIGKRLVDYSPTLLQKAVGIVQKCKFQLLAIILIARALKDVSISSDWEFVLHVFLQQPQTRVQDVLRVIMAGMDSKTHKCIEYYLLTKKPNIDKASLIGHWIAYGGIQTSLEGEHIIKKLCFSFLIEEVSKGFFQMREEIRLALSDIIFSGKDPALVINLGDHGLIEAPESEAWFAKEIILSNNMLFDLPESPKSPCLVKLFLEKNYDLMVVPDSFFECTPVLQVLDLSYTSIKSLPKTISKLVVLREFFLKGCNLLMELPPEISALLNLEVFDIQGTELMYLPEEIGEIVKLKTLRLSFNGRAHLWKENKDVKEIFPRNALSNLSQLNELTIEVFPDGDWWDAEVKAVLDQLWRSSKLITLKLHIPVTELLTDLPYMTYASSKSRFRFIVGRLEQRFISRMPQKAEEEFNNLEKFQKGLKYVNAETIPAEITYVLEHADAFYLERHWTAKSLSEFGFNKIEGLKFCGLVECNELDTIIDTEKFCQQYNKENTSDGENTSDEGNSEEEDGAEINYNSDSIGETALRSLQHLSVHYMKNMESICKGPMSKGFLFNLKTLALHTCPSLTTIFTLSMLKNMINLSEITIEDCPKLNSLVSPESPFSESRQFLPSLTKLSLLELPELVSISNGIRIAPKLEKIVILFCPKLKLLHSTEVSSEVLKLIKGENEWWDALEWHESDLSTYVEENLASLYVALDLEGDLMAQLTI